MAITSRSTGRDGSAAGSGASSTCSPARLHTCSAGSCKKSGTNAGRPRRKNRSGRPFGQRCAATSRAPGMPARFSCSVPRTGTGSMRMLRPAGKAGRSGFACTIFPATTSLSSPSLWPSDGSLRRLGGRSGASVPGEAGMNTRVEASRPGAPNQRPRPRKVIRPARPLLGSIPEDLRSLVQYASLFQAMSATRLKIRYRQSVLGWLWAVLQPLALMLLYAAVFTHVVKYDTGSLPYPLFIMAGLLPWSFCSTAMSTAANGMLSHQPLMAKVYFPREIVPLSYVTAAMFDLLIALVVLLGMMVHYGAPVSPGALFALPIIALLILHAAALCLLLCAMPVRARDLSVALHF